MYYGKSDATTTASGDNTFEFFDDFLTSSSLNTSKWSTSGGGITASGVLAITQSNGEHRFIYTPTTPFAPNTICRIKGSQDGVYTSIQDSYGGLSFTRDGSTNQFQTFSYVTGENRTNIGTGYTGTHIFEQIRNGTTSVIYKIDGNTVATHTTQVPTTNLNLRCIAYQANTGQVLYVHWILVRKYIASEPTPSFGTEQNNS
jgi:hypothetical protein